MSGDEVSGDEVNTRYKKRATKREHLKLNPVSVDAVMTYTYPVH